VQVSEHTRLEKRVEELQAQIAALTLVITSRDRSGVVPSSPVVSEGPALAVSHRGLGDMEAENVTATVGTGEDPPCESAATRSEVTASCEPALTVTSSTPGAQGNLRLANGTVLSFLKHTVPDPPAVSFAADLPWLIQIWDDSSAEWNPLRSVLHIQGHPIAVKHWRDVYCYGKSRRWEGIKKTWTNWQVSFCPHFYSVT
jgi:hypothetical protein